MPVRRFLRCFRGTGPKRQERKSPLPADWSKGAEPLREVIKQIERLFDEN